MKLVHTMVGQKRWVVRFVCVLTLLVMVVGSVGNASVSAAASDTSTSDASTQVVLRGFLDTVIASTNSTSVFGWACAPDFPANTVRVDVYNVADGFRILGSLLAVNQREPAVAAQCGGNPFKGFAGTVNGVCTGRSGFITADIRTFAVFSDSPPINALLPGVDARFNAIC